MSADWTGIAIGKFHTKFGSDRSLPVRRLDWLALGDNIFSLLRELIVIAGAVVNAGRDNAGQSNALHIYLHISSSEEWHLFVPCLDSEIAIE